MRNARAFRRVSAERGLHGPKSTSTIAGVPTDALVRTHGCRNRHPTAAIIAGRHRGVELSPAACCISASSRRGRDGTLLTTAQHPPRHAGGRPAVRSHHHSATTARARLDSTNVVVDELDARHHFRIGRIRFAATACRHRHRTWEKASASSLPCPHGSCACPPVARSTRDSAGRRSRKLSKHLNVRLHAPPIIPHHVPRTERGRIGQTRFTRTATPAQRLGGLAPISTGLPAFKALKTLEVIGQRQANRCRAHAAAQVDGCDQYYDGTAVVTAQAETNCNAAGHSAGRFIGRPQGFSLAKPFKRIPT